MSALLRGGDELWVPMGVQDLDEVVAIEQDVYPHPWTRGNFLDSLSARYSAWTLRDGANELIAYGIFMMALDEVHLLNLSVARDFQRRGYGWQMLEWSAQRAREYGALTMLLEGRPSNTAALRLYQRYGFERIGVRRGYSPAGGEREDALVLRIAL